MSNKQKTAVMQLIEESGWNKETLWSQKYLELEKQQINDAYINGKVNGVATTIGNEINKHSEQYYKETYGE